MENPRVKYATICTVSLHKEVTEAERYHSFIYMA